MADPNIKEPNMSIVNKDKTIIALSAALSRTLQRLDLDYLGNVSVYDLALKLGTEAESNAVRLETANALARIINAS